MLITPNKKYRFVVQLGLIHQRFNYTLYLTLGHFNPCRNKLAIKNVLVHYFIYLGPSRVHALPLAAGINIGGHYFRYFGPSGVRALPLAAGINVGGHYFKYFMSLLLLLVRAKCMRCPWLLA